MNGCDLSQKHFSLWLIYPFFDFRFSFPFSFAFGYVSCDPRMCRSKVYEILHTKFVSYRSGSSRIDFVDVVSKLMECDIKDTPLVIGWAYSTLITSITSLKLRATQGLLQCSLQKPSVAAIARFRHRMYCMWWDSELQNDGMLRKKNTADGSRKHISRFNRS